MSGLNPGIIMQARQALYQLNNVPSPGTILLIMTLPLNVSLRPWVIPILRRKKWAWEGSRYEKTLPSLLLVVFKQKLNLHFPPAHLPFYGDIVKFLTPLDLFYSRSQWRVPCVVTTMWDYYRIK